MQGLNKAATHARRPCEIYSLVDIEIPDIVCGIGYYVMFICELEIKIKIKLRGGLTFVPEL
jgi:hypothetical protein